MEAIYENRNFLSVCEFLPNHLYFVTVQNINNGGSCDAVIPHTDDLHFFTTDNELMYHNFYGDFGPLGITCLYKFCKKLTNKLATYCGDPFLERYITSRFGRRDFIEKMQQKFVRNKIIIYYTSTNNDKRANAAFLISCFAVLYMGFSPRLAHKALQPNKLRYRPFQDASVGLSPYKITMKDCLDAIHKASVFGFFNFNDFNLSECSYYENIEHGDMNWIIPQKFLAFPGPVQERNDYYHHPNFYVEYFLNNNITDVIRLNQKAYDGKCFTMFGIKHHDLFMQDGADPPEIVLRNFLTISENANGALAVHCKAGLGRTGSLIGAYLLKHYRMTAKEAIAWIRICRPGSVIGHQQTWLEAHEEILWYEGNEWRFKMYGKTEIVPFLQYGIYSFDSPKKEFPGLSELINDICKRTKYRFLLKNRPRMSKSKLQQLIRTLLQQGRSTKEKEKADKEPKPEPMYQKPYMYPRTIPEGKNVEYLKPPPQVEKLDYQYQNEYEINQYDQPKYDHQYQNQPNYQKSDYYNPNSYTHQTYDKNAAYSNQDSFYSNYAESDYSNSDRKYIQTGVSRTQRPSEMPKSISAPTKPDRARYQNVTSKSVDKNWKQNNPSGMKFFSSSNENAPKKFIEESVLKNYAYNEDDTCAFDSRLDTISQYSRFNKPYCTKGYHEEPPVSAEDYPLSNEQKIKSRHDVSKSRSPSGFLLSPEDLQSWVETFDEKINAETQGDKLNALKRNKMT